MPRYIIIALAIGGLIILVIILAIFGLLPGGKIAPQVPVSITMWGGEDDPAVWAGVIDGFQRTYPAVAVSYKKISGEKFEETFVNAIAEGKAPDIILLPQTLAVRHREKLSGLPQEIFQFDVRTFANLFADPFAPDLIDANGTIIGLPLFIDTPALFYNKDMFNAAGIAEKPLVWDDVVALSKRFTAVSRASDVEKAGLGAGTGANVERSFEFASSLILQNSGFTKLLGTPKVQFNNRAGDALAFYASFASPSSPNFTWTSRLPSSFTSLSQEQSAMAIGLSRDIPRVLALNPHLNLGVAPFPQQKNARAPAVYGSYFFPTVLKTSRNSQTAWQFILYAAAGAGAEKYLTASRRPAARRDLIAKPASTPELDIFYRQSLIARTWASPDDKTTRRLFTDMLDAIASGITKPTEAGSRLSEQLDILYP